MATLVIDNANSWFEHIITSLSDTTYEYLFITKEEVFKWFDVLNPCKVKDRDSFGSYYNDICRDFKAVMDLLSLAIDTDIEFFVVSVCEMGVKRFKSYMNKDN